MLTEIKAALRITATAYDGELMALAQAGAADLRLAGVAFSGDISYSTSGSTVTDNSTVTDPLTIQAIKTYVRANFGDPADRDWLKASYEDQRGRLANSNGHTEWGE